MSYSSPLLAYVPMVIPYPGAPGAPIFDGKNITHFLDLYDQLCSDHRLSESEKIYRLPWYCEFFIGRYVKILIKDADWTTARSILRREYKDNDLDQLMNFREFLELFKKKFRSEDDNLMQYCYMFASISRDLVSRQMLDRYTQCQWFLQGLPERIVMEIFHQYDIDLEDDDSLDFGNLLEKALVLVKRRKFLADLLQDKETDLIYKHAESQKKIPATPKLVEPFADLAQDFALPDQSQTMQGSPMQEVIPVVRIHTSRVKKASELSLSDNPCILVSDPTEDVYEKLEALFAEPVDEDLEQPSVMSVGPFKHAEGTRIGTQSLNIKSTRTVRKLEPQAPKKDGIGIEKGRCLGLDCLVIERLRQKTMKNKDHG